ncbi:High-affinity nickel-transporter [Cohnella sp. CFH 77786]|uniref:HoxN/HupN/NixA family nickel/cobalt transporter n=1 Tax=Cohnella sp. CFH 77786 TaxID=2662265 RepID=UPI001C60E3F4|nr:High-affinity nickel-transporter [Cohnella sp. CFH 77786]MBW5447615.1 High-affinity nickel-transporter [Cohnella sp. CFH 77786]
MEWLMFPMVFILMGFRHGLDSDHVAAIADMVGVETHKRKQVLMGLMYALGHGAIVLVIGIAAVLVGTHLPEGFVKSMEVLVGASLLVLGALILFSIFKQRENYQYVSRFEMVYQSLRRLFGRNGSRKKSTDAARIGIIGAFVIGIIHGIGAETPTQVALISSTVGLSNIAAAAVQIVFFTVGLLVATSLVTFAASWGFRLLRFKKSLFLALGFVTGVYSVVLGALILGGV